MDNMPITEYDKQAEDFLSSTNSTLEVKLANPQTPPTWDKENKHYKHDVKLSNPKGTYAFEFWESSYQAETMDALDLIKSFSGFSMDSHNFTSAHYKALDQLNKEFEELHRNKRQSLSLVKKNYADYVERLKPSAYSIVAGLMVMYADNFEEWCDEFGYSTDSITAHDSYVACMEQDRMLRRMYTTEQLTQLEEIA